MVSVFLFLTDLVWYSLVASLLLQMALYHSLLWLNSIVCMHHILFIHSSVKDHLGCFLVLAIVNCAAMNVSMHVSFWIIVVLSGYMSRSGIAMLHGNSIFFFFKWWPFWPVWSGTYLTVVLICTSLYEALLNIN